MTPEAWAIFAAQCLIVLIVPGPTNALLAGAGATRGVLRSIPLIAAELAAYGFSIGLLILVVGPVAQDHQGLDMALRLAAAAFLFLSAIRLWRSAGLVGPSGPINLRHVFLITLINPKGLIFAFGVFPKPQMLATEPGHVVVFAGTAALAALAWIAAGAALARNSQSLSRPENVSRAMSVILGFFAILMAGSAMGAAWT